MQLYSFVAAVLLFPVVCKLNIILKLGLNLEKMNNKHLSSVTTGMGNIFSHFLPVLQHVSFVLLKQAPKIVTSSS